MHFFFTSTAIPVVTELGRYLGGRQSEQETIEQKTLRFGKTANLPIHHLIFFSISWSLINLHPAHLPPGRALEISLGL